MKDMPKIWSIIAFALITACLFASFTKTAHAQATCTDIVSIYARGSGEDITQNDGYKVFKERLDARLKTSGFTYDFYSLGTDMQNGYKYPAVDVGNPFNGNAIGAWLSAGRGYDYGESVRKGVLELVGYLNNLEASCPKTRIILAGYSQGAQVIGDTFKAIPKSADEKIDFIALFGDPKLHLPEGFGFFPAACIGKDYSPWRRNIGSCFTSAGSLGARNNPYSPKEFENKTGLWCLAHDFVCGSSRSFFGNDGHKHYIDKNGAIDNAVQEIASILQAKLPKKPKPPANPNPPEIPLPVEPEPTIDLRPAIDNPGADVIFVFDNSSNMSSLRIEMTRLVKSVTQKIVSSGGRVGILSYCGCNPVTSPIFYAPLAADYHPIFHVLSGYEHDRSMSDLSLSLKAAIQQVQASNWRQGVKRIIVPITNAQYAPALITPAKLNKPLLNTARLVNQSDTETLIYPITPPEIAASFNNLAIPNAKVVPVNASSMEAAYATLTNLTEAQVQAALVSTDYYAPPGTELHFDASKSQVYNDQIIKYEWDFDSNGTYDQTTTSPKTTHTYTTEFSGKMTVRITTQNNLKSSTSATVTVTNKAPTIAKAPQSIKISTTSSNTAVLTWEPGDALAASWAISLNGVYIGQLAGERRLINISDLDFTKENIFGVQAIMKNNEVGESGFVTLKPGQNEALTTAKKYGDVGGILNPLSTPAMNLSETPSNAQRSFTDLKWLPHAGIGALTALLIAGMITGCILLYRWKKRSTW